VASGKWQVASGKWQVASGKWQVASGKWQVASGKWQVASGLDCTILPYPHFFRDFPSCQVPAKRAPGRVRSPAGIAVHTAFKGIDKNNNKVYGTMDHTGITNKEQNWTRQKVRGVRGVGG
ncbi:MAG: hypothetical protein LBJ31_08685, partial [Treponema sp.]|nr:hypothetical protein [Treponema sp.]